jgi:hypothetical protein
VETPTPASGCHWQLIWRKLGLIPSELEQDLAITGLQEAFGSSTELCGYNGDELHVLPEYRDHLMSAQSTCLSNRRLP